MAPNKCSLYVCMYVCCFGSHIVLMIYWQSLKTWFYSKGSVCCCMYTVKSATRIVISQWINFPPDQSLFTSQLFYFSQYLIDLLESQPESRPLLKIFRTPRSVMLYDTRLGLFVSTCGSNIKVEVSWQSRPLLKIFCTPWSVMLYDIRLGLFVSTCGSSIKVEVSLDSPNWVMTQESEFES